MYLGVSRFSSKPPSRRGCGTGAGFIPSGSPSLFLSDQEKARLYHYLRLLLDADEPIALLGALRRVAEVKAYGVTKGKIDEPEALLWQALADALGETEKDLRK